MVKQEFVSITFSCIPDNTWLKIVLIKPGEHTQRVIPHRTTGKNFVYLSYKAYFPHDEKKRSFNMVFPKEKFIEAIRAVKPILRQDLDRSVSFEFKKTRRGIISIRGYKYLW